MSRVVSFLVLTLLAAVIPSRADEASKENFPAMFPFKIDLVPQENITNVQTWDRPWEDVGAGAMLTVHNGLFFHAEEPFRFFGTNTCLAANFVDHDQAEKLAAALARFGIGVVRLHHMDMRDIWGKNFERTMTEIDPEQLDRLDYLIAQLEKRGIYVNINLHVSRRFDERDGFENADSFPQHCKGVDLFDRRMIDLQKKYARDLLTHVNPYTGRPYTDDPGVAMIEINNENGIIHQWSWGAIDKLAAPYSDELREMWNRWLLRRFSSTERCREAFGMADFPLGENLISPVPDELSGGRSVGGWQLQVAEGAAGSAEAVGEQNDRVVKITPERIGEHPWFPQLLAQGFSLKKGEVYTLSVTLAAERASDLNVHIQRAASDWRSLGLSRTLGVTDEPKTFTFCFLASEDCDSARFSLSGFEEGNSVRVRGLSLVPGGRVGWEPEQKIEEGTVPTPVKGDALLALEPLRREFFAFLIDLETRYWREMYDYITGELGAKSPVTGTQYGYGSYYAQTMMDYRDIHAYWNHPQFPGKAWDRNNWIERNTSMVFSVCGGNLSSMARARVVGKALVASEYDHPYPMYYRAEGNLMVAAAAAFQGWTGVNQFAWSHNAQLDRQVDSPFFDMCCSPAKLAHLPACFAMLVRGDVTAGPIEYAYYRDLGEEEELVRMAENSSPYDRSATEEQLWLAFVCASGVRLTDDQTGESASSGAVKQISDWSQLPERFGRPGEGEMRNETGQLRWNPDRKSGCFIVDTPGVKVYIGRTPKESVEYGGLTLTLEQSRLNWGAISMTAVRAPGGARDDTLTPGRYLIAATGDVRNSGAKYVFPKPDQITSAADYGGCDGEAPILCEGLGAVIHLSKISAENVLLCPLDGSGNRTAEIPAEEDADGCSVRLHARYKTIWYELVVR
ncbi:MAG: cellulase family glycosylhydrolase [Thermoguttaceae bacterium]|nr:cellulase family glycosylhydrolase [Thermoguttaceae bacterium]